MDTHAAWFLHEETVRVVDGKGEANVVMDRRVGVRPSCSQFLFSDGICNEAFKEHEDNCSVPRQTAAVLKNRMRGRVSGRGRGGAAPLRRHLQAGSWVHSANGVVEYCRERGLGCCTVHNTRVVGSMGRVDKIKH